MIQGKSPCRILVMASGHGSNFQALIDAISVGELPDSRIISLITNRKNAHATARAEKAGIPWEYSNLISHGFLQRGESDEQKVTEGRQNYDSALAARILSGGQEKPELIVLAGWMHVFSTAFLEPLEKAGVKIINLHPALPGEFDGARAIERAFEELKAGRIKRTGIMAHYVIDEVDRGEPIITQEIEWNGEELEELEKKIHSYEHGLIVRATAMVAKAILDRRDI
ncbi:Phosphoribosylglycinamide formyltransferase like protein [Verticillium longisporum]|nr:Phosphoribosylglycinamide formyltransferase like protein [Verticillium longisporum]KAG7150021.1 Phosphoribosylglycinamide formyltransferase like protein [Verticillium longisporum]